MGTEVSLAPWLFKTVTILGASGMTCLIWGLFTNRKHAVWLGHFFVSAHMFMYFVGAEGNWLIGLVTLSFALAGFLFPAKSFEYRGWIYLSLALPPGLLYLFFMGMSAIFLLSGGM